MPTDTTSAKLFTIRDAAAWMNVSVMTVRRIIYSGEVSTYRVGRSIRLSKEDIDCYLEKQHVKGWNQSAK